MATLNDLCGTCLTPSLCAANSCLSSHISDLFGLILLILLSLLDLIPNSYHPSFTGTSHTTLSGSFVDELLLLILPSLPDPSPLTLVSKRLYKFSQDPYVRAHYFLARHGPVQAVYHALGHGRIMTERVIDVSLRFQWRFGIEWQSVGSERSGRGSVAICEYSDSCQSFLIRIHD